jgi:hypothetical protein
MDDESEVVADRVAGRAAGGDRGNSGKIDKDRSLSIEWN